MSGANPLTDSRFRRLFVAQVVALVGTGLSTVALTLLAYDLAPDKASLVLGTVLACKMVAYVLFAPIVGGLAHRFARKRFLVTMDLVRAGLVLLMPLVTDLWHIYVLVFCLNLLSAGFKPVFAATIPEIVPGERAYTRALSLSRLAYDLETLLSPLVAGLALMLVSYSGLFVANGFAFVSSAALIGATRLPQGSTRARVGGLWHQVSFGLRAYLKTPRLRGLLVLYLGVASASSMVIVNTVEYVRTNLRLSESHVAMAFAAAGAGSMLVALVLPRLLDRVADRTTMLVGAIVMAAGIAGVVFEPPFWGLLVLWFVSGMGESLVQTPTGRVVNRSSSADDRSAYFSAQFALSHGCWLLAYPCAGYLAARGGVGFAALVLAGAIMASFVLALMSWPRRDADALMHEHAEVWHSHAHVHDEHHQHTHESEHAVGHEPHTHVHRHAAVTHAHPFVIDDHHTAWPRTA